MLDTINEKEIKDRAGLKFGLSGSAIKMIAIIAMLIDHIGAFLVHPYIQSEALGVNSSTYKLYIAMRIIGRIACPLFMFFIVEGINKTKHPMKYFYRLGIFAIISEIPFDLANTNSVINIGKSNVFFTLFTAAAVLMCLRVWLLKDDRINIYVVCPFAIIGVFFCFVFSSDYGTIGICAVVIGGIFSLGLDCKYIAQKNLYIIMAIAFSLFIIGGVEKYALLSIPIATLYNEKRGFGMKWFFYLFYPTHLIILYFIQKLL